MPHAVKKSGWGGLKKGHSPSDINTKSKALDLHQQCHECSKKACADRYP